MGGPRDDGRRLGLQRERTLLAWHRTVLALVIAVALVARMIGAPWVRLLQVPSAVLALVAVGLWVAADARYRRPVGAWAVGGSIPVRVLWASSVAVGIGGGVAILAA